MYVVEYIFIVLLYCIFLNRSLKPSSRSQTRVLKIITLYINTRSCRCSLVVLVIYGIVLCSGVHLIHSVLCTGVCLFVCLFINIYFSHSFDKLTNYFKFLFELLF